jgi:predicted RNase H-like HicB family nuclease
MHELFVERYGMHVFWSDADHGYIAVFPEVPRISAFGATEEEALAELREVLQAVVEVYVEEGRAIPRHLTRAATAQGD